MLRPCGAGVLLDEVVGEEQDVDFRSRSGGTQMVKTLSR